MVVLRPLALLPVLLLFVLGCGEHTPGRTAAPSPSAPSSSGSSSGPSSGCRSVTLLGFRGQGQPTRGHRGVGREVDQVARALDAALGSAPVRLQRVRFPATTGAAAYDADVATAVQEAGRAIRTACGRVVLVGYSQGAEVVHRVAVAHPGRVALAVLMGDPLRNPTDQVATLTLGTGALGGRGNAGPGERFPDEVRRRVLEVCVRGDDVCNAPLTGRVGPPAAAHHTGYQDLATARGIAARAALLVAGS